MKKIIPYLLVVFSILSIGIFTACGDNASIKFIESYIELNVGDEIDVKSKLEVDNISIDDVSIKSLDSSVVAIKDDKAIAVGQGTTFIKASCNNVETNLEIKVNAEPIITNTPSGLSYNLENGNVVWNPVLVNVDDQVIEVNSYLVSISTQEKEIVKEVIGDNKLKIEESGVLEIKVKCKEYVSNGKTIYKESDYCEPIVLRKLEKPFDLKYDDNTKLLTWDCDASVSQFRVKVNGVLSEIIENKQYSVDLTTTNISKQERFDVSVISVNINDSQDGEIIVQSESEVSSWTRLFAPSLSITNGVITWDNSQVGDFHYEITRTNQSGMISKEIVTNGEYTLSGIASGEYTVSIQAVSDSEQYLSSENISQIENVIKLNSTTLSFNPITKEIIASNYQDQNIELHISYRNKLEKIVLNNGKFVWNKTDEGNYNIVAYVMSQNNNEINSDVSNEINLIQLPNFDLSAISQQVKDGKYFVEFGTIQNANQYELSYTKNDQQISLIKQIDGSYGDVNTLFDEATTYSVKLTASSTEVIDNSTFILPSSVTLTVVRQNELVASLIKDSNQQPSSINWNDSPMKSYYYELDKNAELFLTDTINTNSISIQSLDFGNYQFKVKSVSGLIGGVLYLESLNFAVVDFAVEYKLNSPEISFDRNSKIVTVNKVENATSYQITFNGDLLIHDDTKNVIQIDLTSKLIDAGSYTIGVIAKNLDNVLVLDSNINEIVIIKLDAPKQFNVTSDGIVLIQNYPNSQQLDLDKEEILINDIASVTLNDGDVWTVKAKYNSNTNKVNNIYYLDSDYAEFNIQRLSIPQKPVLNETIISWNQITNANFEYELTVKQNDVLKTISLEENQIDVFSSNFKGIDLSKDFVVSVEYKFIGEIFSLDEKSLIYYTSNESESTLIQKIQSDVKMYVAEENGVTTVNWTASTVEGVTYNLYLDGSLIYSGNLNSYNLTDLCKEEKEYKLRLKISKQGYLTSEFVEINVERLQNVSFITIDEEENIIVDTKYNDSSYVFVGNDNEYSLEELVQLENIKITINDEDVTNLIDYDGKFEVCVQLIAKEYTEGNYYYLNSGVNTFKFSRIPKLSMPQINDNTISWDNIENVNDYRLMFQSESVFKVILLNGTNYVSTNSQQIQEVISQLNSNSFTVMVQAVVGEFVINVNEEHLLSSSYSQASAITKLQNVNNIQIVSENDPIEQKTVKISWDYSFDGIFVKQFKVDIYKDNELFKTEYVNGTNNYLIVEDMLEAGVYYVEIMVLGTQNCLDSGIAKSSEVTRLSAPTNISISQDGLITWNGVENAQKYSVTYYFNSQINGKNNNITSTNWNIQTNLYQYNFSGNVKVNVIAIGGEGKDLGKTLSSINSVDYVFTKPSQANIVLETNKLVVSGTDEGENNVYLVTIKTDNRVVKTIELNNGAEYYYEDWYYQDTKEKVPTNVEKVFDISVQKIVNSSNYVKSDITNCSVTKLKEAENFGVIRKEDSYDSPIWVRLDVVNNATKYIFSIQGTDFVNDSFTLSSTYAEFALTDDIYVNIPQNWTFDVYSQGIIDGEKNYIDSAKVTISGQKLNSVSNFGTQNGILVWDKNSLASDYALKVSNDEVLSGYVNDGIHTLNESLVGKFGELSLNIKAVGNVRQDLMTTNIILDSTYILNNENQIQNYNCTKLETPTNYSVTEGYISFKEVDKATGYQAVVLNNYYDLSIVESEQQDYTRMYSTSMYSSLAPNTEYLVEVRAISNQNNVMYSDCANSIKIKILANNSSGTLKIVPKTISTNPTKYDYTISQLVWNADANAINGYNVNISGNLSKTMSTTFVLENSNYLEQITYDAKIAIAGSSSIEQDGCYYLNSHYSESVTFSKLITPIPSIVNGTLVWSASAGATGYLVYLGGELITEQPVNTLYYNLNIGDISSNKKYSKFEVKAISTDTSYIASDFGVYTDEYDEIVEVTKLHSPDKLTVDDGALKWIISDIQTLNTIASGEYVENPFTANLQSLMNKSDEILFKFKNKSTNEEFTYTDYGIYYLQISDSLISILQTMGLEDYIDLLQHFGWPTMNYSFLDRAKDLPAGAYDLSLSQKGNSLNFLNSNYGKTQEVYIPYAPNIQIVYSQNQYVLSWNAISIPSQYNIPTTNYIIVVEDNNGERYKLGETTNTTFNLTELVEKEQLIPKYTKIYVYVEGNSVNVLNGKVSNVVSIKVLDKTVAYVHNGELYWNAQEGASEYLISYTITGNDASTKTVTVTQAHWTCDELSSSVESYNIKIQAVGVKNSTKDSAVITGMNCDIGKLTKLETPTVSVNNGVFVWTAINNSSSYAIYVNNNGELLAKDFVSNEVDADNKVWYETKYDLSNLLYKFQAIGDLDLILNSETLAYVNSNSGSDIYGTAVPIVENVVAKNGKLVWTITKNNSVEISHYKLIFNSVDENGNLLNSEFILTGGSFKDVEDMTTCSYDCSDLEYGFYKVTIQAYYETSDIRGTYSYNGTTAYYLMSIKTESYMFEKYNVVQGVTTSGVLVDNIALKDGTFTWEYAGEIDEVNYEYELKFISSSGEEYKIITEDTFYSGYIVKKLVNTNYFELYIRVVAKDGVVGFVNSDYVKFTNINNNNLSSIYQIDGIDQNDIILTKMDEGEDLYINWEDYEISTGNVSLNSTINVQYLISYWTSEDSDIQTKLITQKYINTSEFEFTINDEFTLYYQIQVLPLGELSYVASYPCEVREIKKPKSVEEVYYNSTEEYFYWATDGTSNDHSYKIRDQILKSDSEGNVILENGEPIVVRTYFFTTQDNLTDRYYPVEQGVHLVSVAVVVKNSGNEGSLTSSYTYYYDKLLEPDNKDVGTKVLTKLFTIGAVTENQVGAMGTVENPYIISTSTHFSNIAYRLNKPEYQNRYVLRINGEDTTVTLNNKDTQFCFKQINDIYNVKPLGNGETFEFKGNYDGNMNLISWDYDLLNISNATSRQYVALFAKIGEGASVTNLKVIANLTNQPTIGATIAILCYENAGLIDNVVIGEQGMSFNITSKKDIYWFGVSYINYETATISRVVNYYSVTLKNGTDVLGIRVGYAGITGTNRGIVSRCANYGDIYLQSTQTTSGGIVGINYNTVERCVLKNTSTTINISKETSGAVSIKFGGVVGQNSGTISYCYTYTRTIINRNAPNTSNNQVYIAGLVGTSDNGQINHSYVKNEITATSASGIEIGNVYVFAHISSASSNSGVDCYYNQGQSQSAVGGLGTANFNQISSYVQRPSGSAMNENETPYYTVNENNFPVLVWENEFAQLWQ